MLSQFANLPAPIRWLTMLAGGAGIASIIAAILNPSNPFFKTVAIGVVVVVVLVALYILFLKMRDKAKSGPFASLIAKAGAGRPAADPAQKARMDDLRKKFEEGVGTFKGAGKDIYSLPWFLLVGPSGSGKTEAMRHCNVGFPPGLQDCLQGSGGTLNMHWWFTNHAVVLDTAGRMFMEEGEQSSEWKEFMKLLKQCRPNSPINGLLLVISSESLLKDSAEKIEQTAGAIARQLDVVQRTLDVRFPVFVVVTKCDKIVGFRDYFETINDPALQHQILGWSNPAPLDEAFRPDTVDKHLETVRQKLMKRRMGLLQNPVHTRDASERRTDEVDELFELPDNLVRISPRLRRYLEMIFVAGEWSPKPLFLRGIYFTSSMREGQALDMTLASALGVDVESLPTGREWDKEKAYFLRDVFLSKVFKERGLVTRATNVGKQLAKQRRLMVGGSMAAVILLMGITVLGYFQFNSSLGPPSAFWKKVGTAYAGDEKEGVEAIDLNVIRLGASGWLYRGGDEFDDLDVLGDEVPTRVALMEETARQSGRRVEAPLVAKPIAPFLGFGGGFAEGQVGAHRAVVERAVVAPLLSAARSKLASEDKWTPEAVAALSQLVRVQTYSFGSTPADSAFSLTDLKPGRSADKKPVVDVDALFKYVLTQEAYQSYKDDKDKIVASVAAAYADGWGDDGPSPVLGGKDEASVLTVTTAVDHLVQHLKGLGASPGSEMDHLTRLHAGLMKFREDERLLQALQWIKVSGADAAGAWPANSADYTQFESGFLERVDAMKTSAAEIDLVASSLGANAGDPVGLLLTAGEGLQKELASYFTLLREQLPRSLTDDVDINLPGPADKGDKAGKAASGAKNLLAAAEPEAIKDLRTLLNERSTEVSAAVKQKLETMRTQIQLVAPLMVSGRADRTDARAYTVRFDAYRLAGDEVRAAAGPGESAPSAGIAAPLVEEIGKVDAATARAVAAIGAWSSWVPDSAGIKLLQADQQSVLNTERDAALRASRKAAEIAQSRRLHELAKRAIAQWPKDGDELSGYVKDVATARIEDATFKKWNQPAIALTDMEEGGEFNRSFHPDAAKEVLTGWTKLKEMVDPDSTGQRRVIGREQLRDRVYARAAEASSDYAKSYIRFWHDQAAERGRPSVATWADFGNKLKAAAHFEINDELTKLKKHAEDALAGVPPSPAWNDLLERSKTEVANAFSGLENPGFQDETKTILAAWKRLSAPANGPARARETLLDAQRGGTIKPQYFSVYRGGAKTVRYWDGFLLKGLELLVRETQGELSAARDTLVKVAKGVPLAFGPADRLDDLTPEQVKAARAAADKLDAAPAGTAAPADDLDDEIRAELRRLSGADFVGQDAATRTWFGRVKGLLKLFGDKPVTTQVTWAMDYPRPERAALTDDARTIFRYGAVYVGATPRGKPNNLTNPIPDDVAKEIRIELPTPADQPMAIFLYMEDPRGDAAKQPDLKIQLPGRWGVLRAMLTGQARRVEQTGEWQVLTVAEDQKTFLWVSVKFDPEVPLPSEWPRAEQWPAP